MGSWLRQKGEELSLKPARGTPAELRVSFPAKYRMYQHDATDEDILNSFYPGTPKEIIRFRAHVLAGPIVRDE